MTPSDARTHASHQAILRHRRSLSLRPLRPKKRTWKLGVSLGRLHLERASGAIGAIGAISARWRACDGARGVILEPWSLTYLGKGKRTWKNHGILLASPAAMYPSNHEISWGRNAHL